jgi:hypothetical protein
MASRVKSVLHFVAICILTNLLFMSCSKDGAGDIVTKTFNVQGYHTIEVDGVLDVVIVQDSIEYVEFSGEARNISRCVAVVTDSFLHIDGSKRGEFFRPNEMTTKAIVHVRNLRLIEVNEDCHISSSNFVGGNEFGVVSKTRFADIKLKLGCNIFYYWNNVNGTHVELEGRVQTVKLWNSGLGGIDASQLDAEYAEVVNGSQSDVKVRATTQLDYGITSIGNIIYFGNPGQITGGVNTGNGLLIKGD